MWETGQCGINDLRGSQAIVGPYEKIDELNTTPTTIINRTLLVGLLRGIRAVCYVHLKVVGAYLGQKVDKTFFYIGYYDGQYPKLQWTQQNENSFSGKASKGR